MTENTALDSQAPDEPLDLDIYPDAEERKFMLPPRGRYLVRAPEGFPETAFRDAQSGFLSSQIDPTIVGPTHENFLVRFTRVSAKPFMRKVKVGGEVVSKPASQLGDYLRALGRRGRIPLDKEEQKTLVCSTAGQTYEVELDWEARNHRTGYKVKGMHRFPTDGNGGYQWWVDDPSDLVEHPTEKNPDGSPKLVPKRLRAQIVVTRYVPQG